MNLAISNVFEGVATQRCLFHLWSNVRVLLTLNPQGECEKELLVLAKILLRYINNRHDAVVWKQKLFEWEERWKERLKQRTYNSDPYAKKKWWYTHKRTRSAHHRLKRNMNHLFHFVDNPVVPKTTNHVEGGINSPIQRLIVKHSGMPVSHQQKMVETYLQNRNLSTQSVV